VQDGEQNVHFVRYRTLRDLLFFRVALSKLMLSPEQMSSFILLFVKVRAQKKLTDIGGAAAGSRPQCWNGEDDVTNTVERNLTPRTTGLVVHWATRYDLLLWLVTLGRERGFRERVLRLARLESGESILDVGCGPGTLAIAAKRHVGPTGAVHGIDASPEMIARAGKKARKAGVEVVFKNALAEALPFPDAQFDAVLSTVMLHHLPRKVRQQCAHEIRRVLKPGGRVLTVDFGGAAQERKTIFGRLHRHGYVKLPDMIAVLSEAGLISVESGAVGISDLQFVLAAARPST
jgi:ubiquinone/menaquinone biosynthesis C-methylase UbiE